MSYVFVVDQEHRPLDPIHPGLARRLLSQGKASVWRRYPFTLLLKTTHPEAAPQPLRLKLDPGSQTTGIALVNDTSGQVIWAAELTHRGEQVRERLAKRHAQRRLRRQRKTRYRPRRFHNRRRPIGWLPPSLLSRMQNVLTWVNRLRKWCPITAISLELVKFDLQQLEDPTIGGISYQKGTLAGYELREWLLEKWQRTCAYCSKSSVPLEIDHVLPLSRGGSNRVSNLVIACHSCNRVKGNQSIEQFLQSRPEVLARVQVQRKQPLKGATVVNSARWQLYERLKEIGLPLETGSGGRTKWNRTQRALPKTHWLDASCIGASTPPVLKTAGIVPLHITATGRQRRQMCLVDKRGFPRTRAREHSVIDGFRTGDLARAVVTSGKKVGTYIGRMAIRKSKSFNITTKQGTIEGLHARFFTPIHRSDGYAYQKGGGISFTWLKASGLHAAL